MIAITGAGGKTGRALIHALRQAGHSARALLRREAESREAESLIGDMLDSAVLRRLLDGADALYHIAPNMHPEEVLIGKGVIQAAQEAGVSHFVYHSVLHPALEAMPHHWNKLRVEEMLIESGLPFTVLQPAAYMQNVLAERESMFNEGIFRVPYSVTARISMVDLLDVAEAARIVLTAGGHEGAIYELAGPEALTQEEVAGIIGEVVGRPVTAEEVRLEAGAKKTGLSDYGVETLLKMFRHYAAHGFVGNPRVLGWLLGRPPADFRAFALREFRDTD